jgi:hypothetical protein
VTAETWEEVVTFFEDKSDEYGRFFVPDDIRDEKIAKSLLSFHKKHYDADLLLESIELYIAEMNQPIVIYEFAIRIDDFRESALNRRRMKEEVQSLMKQTEIAMTKFKEDDS